MKKYLSIILSVFTFIILTGCPDPGGNGTNIPPGGIVEITENINDATTWAGDTLYLIRKWNLYVYNTLTIEPGAIIKFHPTEGPELLLGGSGTIIAQGTADNPIIFTSYKDDTHGGDTNGDGSSTSPGSKDWASINTIGQNGSVFNYCEFYYGGGYECSYTLSIDLGSNATVTNCIFAHNDGSQGSGCYGALAAYDAGAGTVIQNNTFFDNIRPLSINTLYDIDDSNIFHDPDDLDVTNIYNGIFVYSVVHISGHINWKETEVAYVINDNDWYINTGGSLTLADNVVLKFMSDSCLLLTDGASALVNHDGTDVAFTSYKDDTLKGDTNADGTTSAADGDWDGIYDISAPAPPYYFAWSNIYYDSSH